MLPGGTDGLYRSVLAAPHTLYARVDVYDGYASDAILLAGNIPFTSGAVGASLTSRVARSLSLGIDSSWYPRANDGILAPYGNVIRAYRGVVLGDGSTTYSWPVFAGRIRYVQKDNTGQVRIEASDFGADIVDFGFENPENSSAGVLVPNEVKRLINQVLPGVGFGVFDDYTETVKQLTWEQDRGAALDEMAFAVGSYWYALADGQFVLRKYPWTVVSSPTVTLADGPGGVVTSWAASRSRDQVFNSVVVTGERLSGDRPALGIARDLTPGSPTEYAGKFGVRTEFLRLQTPGSDGAAMTAAQDALRRDIALQESWSWDMAPDASLELGDLVTLNVDGETGIIQVVASLVIPLDLSGPMAVTGRSLVVPVLSQSG